MPRFATRHIEVAGFRLTCRDCIFLASMKRSEINHVLRQAEAFFAAHHFQLPPFAAWTQTQWQRRGHEADEIRTRRLGWDVTDFGMGQFDKFGLLLFTLRNGLQSVSDNKKLYAEKIMIVREGQITPYHFHFQKIEDIINRGAGRLVVRLRNSTPAGEFADMPVEVSCDGVVRTVSPDAEVVLGPGESITLIPGVYHMFYAQQGAGAALIGEVSSINDDAVDNRFHQPLPRYPKIEEDEAPYRLLCAEYPSAN